MLLHRHSIVHTHVLVLSFLLLSQSQRQRQQKTNHPIPKRKQSILPSSTMMYSMLQAIKANSFHRLDLSENKKWNKASDEDDCTVATEETTNEKCVAFAPMVNVRQTIARSDYELEELSMCWYTSEEYNAISIQCAKQIEKLNRGEKLNGKKYCTRGLEGHTESRSMERRQSKMIAVNAVLDEQDAQDYAGDWEAISKVYRDVSSSCQSWAHMVALCDERAVQKIIKQDSSNC